MSKGMSEDILNTIQELLTPQGYSGKNWLRHGGLQEKLIDEMLLKGAPEDEIAKEIIRKGFDKNHKGKDVMIARVRNHIRHLSNPVGSNRDGGSHGLPLVQENGSWKFDLKKMEQIRLGDRTNPILSYLPNKADVEFAESQLRKSSDDVIDIEKVLNKIKDNFDNGEKTLKENWRLITKLNIEVWFGRKQ